MPVSMKSCWMSRSRQGVLLSRYSEPPSRKTRRVMVTSFQSSPSSSSQSAKVIETSAMPSAGAGVGAGEDDVRHLAAAQRLGRLLAEHPADGVEDVRFAAAVRADHAGDALVEIQDRLRGERLEAEELERFEVHGGAGEVRRLAVFAASGASPYVVVRASATHKVWERAPGRCRPPCAFARGSLSCGA